LDVDLDVNANVDVLTSGGSLKQRRRGLLTNFWDETLAPNARSDRRKSLNDDPEFGRLPRVASGGVAVRARE
jgi:hypothetical protein